MKFSLFGFFGFVFCGAATACADRAPLQPSPEDSGLIIVDAGDASLLDDSSRTGDADSPVPLIIAPDSPSLPTCTNPFAPVLEAVPAGARLPVFAASSDGLSVATSTNAAAAPSNWNADNSIVLPQSAGSLAVFATISASDCAKAKEFAHTYSLQTSFAPAAGSAGSSAVGKDDPRVTAWATQVLSVTYGDGVSSAWQTPQKALGPATQDTTDVVSLGEGGSIVLGFDVKLTNGDGYDLVVYENGFADNYLELAYVEVSSDGVHFVRFDSASTTTSKSGPYGTLDPTQLEGLAGKYRVGYGTPFDLAWLSSRPEAQSGIVDLEQITAVRIVDVIGDGRNRDSFGHVIFDPYPTVGSAGFDLEALGILNSVPQ